MLYNRCTGICKFGYNTYPRRIRRRSNLGHIFRGGGSASHGPGNTVSSVRNSLFKTEIYFFISNFLHVAIVLFFPVGDTPASEFYVPTFRHTVFFNILQMEQIVPKRRHIKFRRHGITQKERIQQKLISFCYARINYILPPYSSF